MKNKTPAHRLPLTARRHHQFPISNFSLVSSLLRDESGVTATEYMVAALALVIATVAASKTIGNALILYLHRIYLVVTLPIP
jgi:Flp pilus assembly pilin Flp